MGADNVLYYDGASARPSRVQVLVFHDHLHLHKKEDPAFYESFPLSGASKNPVGSNIYLYLDKTGLKYLQFTADHPYAAVFSAEVEKHKGSLPQRLLKQRALLLMLIMVISAIGVYLLIVNLIPFIGMRVISVKQEITIGDKLKTVMVNQAQVAGEHVDSICSGELQQFANQLKLSSRYPIRTTVVNSDIVNAYALPGGNVVVYKGILKRIQTAEALAALLAHESTHINERHTLRSLLRNTANGILISLLFGDASGISGAIVSNAETLNGFAYSRSLEKEADLKGMGLLHANKVNVDGMRQLMQTLQSKDELPGRISFFSTHPLTKERIRAAELFAERFPQPFPVREDLKKIFDVLKEQIY